MCASGKSPGVDTISYEFLKHLPSNWLLYLTSFFGKILETCEVPREWGNVLLTMLHKKGPTNDPLNYRGIALINCITKLFTKIISNRLEDWAESNNVIPECQNGFRKFRGCTDNLYVLTSTIHLHLRLKKRKIFALFIDFRRAFDTIDHNLLWQKMYNLGISASLINTIKSMYDHASFKVKVNNDFTKPFNITQGVLQGDSLSPLLFSLFLSDIESFFRRNGCSGINIDNNNDLLMLLYADDLVILSDSKVDLARKISVLERYCDTQKLTVNSDKTKIMRFSRGNSKPNYKFSYKGNALEVVNKYSYLGIPLTTSAVFRETATYTSHKATQAIGSVFNVMIRTKMTSWQARIKLYNSLVLSVLLVNAPVWSLRYCDVIERVQVSFFKRLLFLSRNTPDHLVRLETGSIKLSFYVFKLTVNWLEKLLTMNSSRLPKICFQRQISLLKTDCDIRYNWAKQVETLFEKIYCGDELSKLTLQTLKNNKKDWLTKFRDNCFSEDHVSATSSRYPLFFLAYTQLPQKYLTYNVHISYIRIFAQLRLCNRKLLKLSTRGITYKIDYSELCTICNLNKLQSLEHILFECPPLKLGYEQHNFFTDINALQHQLTNTNIQNMKILFHAITNVLKLRSFVLNE